MDYDLIEGVLEQVAEQRLDANQRVRQRMIKQLTVNVENTAEDPKLAYILLAALKDADNVDIKRMGLKQNEREIDNRARVVSGLEDINNKVTGNPFYVAEPKAHATGIAGRPDTFYTKEDFVDGELDIETKLTNYNDFMRSRNAIPSEANLDDSDSAS